MICSASFNLVPLSRDMLSYSFVSISLHEVPSQSSFAFSRVFWRPLAYCPPFVFFRSCLFHTPFIRQNENIERLAIMVLWPELFQHLFVPQNTSYEIRAMTCEEMVEIVEIWETFGRGIRLTSWDLEYLFPHLVNCIYMYQFKNNFCSFQESLCYSIFLYKSPSSKSTLQWETSMLTQDQHLNSFGSASVPDASCQVSGPLVFWFWRQKFLKAHPYCGFFSLIDGTGELTSGYRIILCNIS